ncbi:hypothetical protein EI94DRAFT_1705254 [Lactarius quietus]|nr:hypothetical protein EI94DRAFT_1705254 [Lactarius quietus]
MVCWLRWSTLPPLATLGGTTGWKMTLLQGLENIDGAPNTALHTFQSLSEDQDWSPYPNKAMSNKHLEAIFVMMESGARDVPSLNTLQCLQSKLSDDFTSDGNIYYIINDIVAQIVEDGLFSADLEKIYSFPITHFKHSFSTHSLKPGWKPKEGLFIMSGSSYGVMMYLAIIPSTGTSTEIGTLHMQQASGICKQIRSTEQGCVAFDCEKKEEILFTIGIFTLPAENPMQSELASHIGLKVGRLSNKKAQRRDFMPYSQSGYSGEAVHNRSKDAITQKFLDKATSQHMMLLEHYPDMPPEELDDQMAAWLALQTEQMNPLLTVNGSLIGQQFKQIIQAVPFVIHGLVDENLFMVWLAAGKVAATMWFSEIDNDDLRLHIDNFLNAVAIVDLECTKAKPKFHILTHTLEDVQCFGPVITSSTEIFECNNQSSTPSRDNVQSFCSLDDSSMLPVEAGGKMVMESGPIHAGASVDQFF